MTVQISERAFEDAIECALLRHGPDDCPDEPTGVQEPRRNTETTRYPAASTSAVRRTTTAASA